MIMVYKHMMSKKHRTDVTNLGNLFIVDRIWTTLVSLVSGGKLWLVLVKLVVVSVGGVFFCPRMSEQTCTCVTNTNTRRSLHKVNFLSLFVFELLLQGKLLFYFHQRNHQTRTSNHGVTSNQSCLTLSSFILVWISFKFLFWPLKHSHIDKVISGTLIFFKHLDTAVFCKLLFFVRYQLSG